MRKSLVLGKGFIGAAIVENLLSQGDHVTSTKRGPHSSSSDLERCLLFHLDDPATWTGLQNYDRTFWTFSTLATDRFFDFLNQHHQQLGQIVVLGSISSLIANPQWECNEESSRGQRPRDVAESYLQEKLNAQLVFAAGLYGGERHPFRWIKAHRIQDFHRNIHLIHREDLAEICVRCSFYPEKGRSWLAVEENPYNLLALKERAYEEPLTQDLFLMRPETINYNGAATNVKLQYTPLPRLGISLNFKDTVNGSRESLP